MKKYIIGILISFISTASIAQKEFIIKSEIPGIKDGIVVGLMTEEDTENKEIAVDTVKNGKFTLRGKLDHPTLCTLSTNNLNLLGKDQDTGKIRWTYTNIFVSDTTMTFAATAYDSIANDAPIGKYFRITGGRAQADFNEYNLSGIKPLDWIKNHPHSVLSVKLANDLIRGGSGLRKLEIQEIANYITSVPDDTERLSEFRRNCEFAKRTAVGEPILDLPLFDTKKTANRLTNIIPKGRYTLIDFWASWCGICRSSIPDIKSVAKKHPNITIVGVSADSKYDQWINAIKKEKMEWKQYCLTIDGGKQLLEKYLITGVPFYIIVDPQGQIVRVPQYVSEIDDYFTQIDNKK